MRRTVSSDNGKNGKPVRNHVESTANRAEKGLSNIRQPPEAVRAHRKSKGEYVCWRLVLGFEISRKWIITKSNVPPHSLDKEAYTTGARPRKTTSKKNDEWSLSSRLLPPPPPKEQKSYISYYYMIIQVNRKSWIMMYTSVTSDKRQRVPELRGE